MSKKWTNVLIPQNSRQYLGALAKDFLVSAFEEETLSEDDIDFLMDEKTRKEFQRELVEDKELDEMARQDLQSEDSLKRFTRYSYSNLLKGITWNIEIMARNESQNEGLKWELQKTEAHLEDFITALSCWEGFYVTDSRITMFQQPDGDEEKKDLIKKIAKGMAHVKKEAIQSVNAKHSKDEDYDAFLMRLMEESDEIRKREITMDKTIPAIANARETLKDAYKALGQYVEEHPQVNVKRFGILRKALEGMMQGFDELEMQKHFSDFSTQQQL